MKGIAAGGCLFLAALLQPPQVEKGQVRLQWLGHAYFLIQTSSIRVAIDPYNERWGYPVRRVEADVCLCSHGHLDHAYTDAVEGNPEIVRGPLEDGETKVRGITVRHVSTFHDEKEGAERGKNTVFLLNLEGIRIAHAGDLGHVLTEEQVKKIGEIDVLLVPCGGKFVLTPEMARRVVDQLRPKIAIPMHFRTKEAQWLPHGVEEFTEGLTNVRKLEEKALVLTKKSLPAERSVFVMRYDE